MGYSTRIPHYFTRTQRHIFSNEEKENMATNTRKNNTGIIPETDGAQPLLAICPVIEIEGTTYTLRRLSIPDTFRVMKMIGKIMAGLGPNAVTLSAIDLEKPETIATKLFPLLLNGLQYAEQDLMAFLADVIGVTPAELADPERFPIYAVMDIINGLVNHPDFTAFFTKLATFAQTPDMLGLLNGK
jgi:hypothetical protein